ncbi:MAG: gliding motility-associated C-terminal domain-containing protein [Lentimicrobiaceae bacterium]|nr:gliding motility-associated C-terminal domain-containing protein [Lentimicrobiaceae bacterium]
MRKIIPFAFFILLFFSIIPAFPQEAQLETDEGLGKYDYIEKDDSTWVHWATTLNSWTSANVKVKVNNQTVDYPSYWMHDGTSPWIKHLSSIQEVSNKHFNATDWIAGAKVSLTLQLNGVDKANYNNEMALVDVATQSVVNNKLQNATNQLVLQFSVDIGSLSGITLKGLWVKNFGSLSEATDINKVKIYYEDGTTFSYDGNEAGGDELYGTWTPSTATDNIWGKDEDPGGAYNGLNIAINPGVKKLFYVVIESFKAGVTYGRTAQFGINTDGMQFNQQGADKKLLVRIDAHKNASVLPLVSCSDVIHYWSFNASTGYINPDISLTTPAATITNDFIPSSLNNAYTGTLLNATTGTPAGQGLTVLVNTALQNNNKHLFLNIPTTGYKNVIVSYALRKSGNAPSAGTGFQSHDIHYTTDGTTWIPFITYTIDPQPIEVFGLKTLDFSGVAGVENNPNFKVRFTMKGGSNSNGNNRFDNIKINAIDINLPSIANQPVSPGVCENSSATFTVVANGSSLNYQWYLCQPGGVWGTISGETSASYTTPATTLAMNGNMYYCEVWSSVNPGCNRIISNVATLTVNELPEVSISGTYGPYCTFNPAVTLTGTPAGGTFSGPGVTGNQFNPATAGAGSHAIVYSFTDGHSCSNTDDITIVVNPDLPVSVTISTTDPTTICEGGTVNFTANVTNPGSAPAYQWKLNGNPITGAISQNYAYTGTVPGGNISCTVTSNATCATGSPATSSATQVTINPNLPVSVTISTTDPTTICEGGTVNFTANVTNPGSAPAYQWKLNGNPITGAISQNYAYTGIVPGGNISCTVTSNATCATGSSATSSAIQVTVNPNLPVSVTISTTSPTTICAGTSVIFTATPTNGGATPSYQWKVNTSNAGSNSATFEYIPANNDVVSCVLSSSEACTSGNPATSNSITMTVNPLLTVSLSIEADPGTSVCAGNSVTFTATPVNGGTTPVYQWYVNGGTVGANNPVYTYTPNNNDNVYCMITAGTEVCTTQPSVTSNTILMTVNDQLPIIVDVTADPGTSVCEGEAISFQATVNNPGTSDVFQWYLNSSAVGGNSSSYTLSTPADGDEVYCIVTSSLACATGSPAQSAVQIIEILSVLNVEITISADPSGTVCEGEPVTFTADANAGSNPNYDWLVNDVSTGVTTVTFTPVPTLNNNDKVQCKVTSISSCAINNPATSLPIIMSVSAPEIVTVTISSTQGNNVCSGTTVDFTSAVDHGGTSPAYTWKVNGISMVTTPNYSYQPNDGDIVTCEVVSNEACVSPVPPNAAVSNSITMTVVATSVAQINITSDAGNSVCENTQVNYTATYQNEGTNPIFQWKVNGSNQGTNSSTFSFIPVDGDKITCELTSNQACVSNPIVTSNEIIMTVSSQITVSVTISPSGIAQACEGEPITFTAYPVGGGTNPAYTWYLNDNPQIETTSSFTLLNPADGDEVYCKLTSDILCATGNPAQSPVTIVEIVANLVPAVSIADPPIICEGNSFTVTAIPVNGGTPSYQWYLNNIPAGTNNVNFDFVPADGDEVYVVMTSSFNCATPNTATSNTITFGVSNSIPVSVTISISGNPGNTICEGTTVSFLADGQNGGTNPTYEWFVNGVSQGAASTINSFSYKPVNNDIVSCIFNSDLTNCVTGNPATSNLLAMQVASLVDVQLSISSSEGNNICEGTEVTFTASPVNGGNNPVYQWTVNNSPVGTNSNEFIYTPSDSDEVNCYIVPDVVCPPSGTIFATPISFIVSEGLEVSISITADLNTEVCQGDIVEFTANANNGGSNPLFEWQVNGSTKSNNAVFYYAPSDGDQIQCLYTSDLNCAINNPAHSNSFLMTVHNAPQIDLSSEEYLCAGTPVILDAGAGFSNYLWQDGSAGQTFTASDKGIYWVQVTDGFGCVGNDTVEMKLCFSDLKLPNAFTPNGDGLNDKFNGLIDPDVVTKYQIRIFNRWNELLFEGTDPHNGWDGSKNSNPCPAGAYIWEVAYDTQNNQGITITEHKRGTVMLIR